MAQFNENIKLAAPNPLDSRYMSTRTSAGAQLPYSGTSEVTGITGIVLAQRYLGQTVLINTGITGVEYWFKEGITDTDLIEKKFSSEQLVGEFITGATNLGYFSGQTGIQKLALSSFGVSTSGFYFSEYNWYYGDSAGIIRIGSPTHNGVLRRAYVKEDKSYSWIYNVNVNGWSVATGDITENVGSVIVDNPYAIPRYTEEDWTVFVSTTGTSVTPSGSLTTGDTLIIGNPIFNNKSDQDLNLRTLISETSDLINLRYDDNFIYFSGGTTNQILTASNGLTTIGTNVELGGTLTGTTTIIRGSGAVAGIQYGDSFTTGFTSASLVNKAYVDSVITSTSSLIKSVCNPITDDYTTVSTDYYVGVTGGTTVRLSGAQTDGQVIVVADVLGNASPTCYIQVIGAFFGASAISCIDTSYSSMSYIFNSEKNKWSVVGFTPAIV